MDLHAIAIDPAKLAGQWWEVERAADGTLGGRVVPAPTANGCFLVVPMGTAYERAVDDAMAPFRSLDRAGRMSDEEREQVLGQALGKTVLRGWANLTAGGQPVEFSEAKAIELMTDRRWLFLREFVLRAGAHRASLLQHEEEEARGNSPRSSPGICATAATSDTSAVLPSGARSAG